jgi:4-amino-4-deoxy-L-arabinose transferase-like glycosyltransferase
MSRFSVLTTLIAAVVFGATSLLYPLTDWDQASATLLGETILRGGAPYVDAWNVKAPGIYFLYALKLLLFGKSDVGLRVFDLLWQTVTALVIAAIATRVFAQARAGALAGVAYLAAYYATSYWTWAEADGFLTLPLALGMLALLRAQESDRAGWWVFAGAGVGAAVLIKLAFGLIGVAMLAVAWQAPPRSAARAVLRWACLAVGLTAPLAICAAYLAAKGSWHEFVATQFVLAPQVTARLRELLPPSCILQRAGAIALGPAYLLAAVAIVSFVDAARRGEMGMTRVAMMWWLLVGLITLVLHGAYLPYHFLPLIAPAAILSAGPVADGLWAAPSQRSRRTARVAALAGVAFFLLLPLWKTAARAREMIQWISHPPGLSDWGEVAWHIRAHSAADDAILVWGNAPVVYLLSERRPASRFIVTLFLQTEWRGVDYRRTFEEEFRRNQPRFVVVRRPEPPLPCAGLLTNDCQGAGRYAFLEEQLARDYRIQREFPAGTLYVRVEASGATTPR